MAGKKSKGAKSPSPPTMAMPAYTAGHVMSKEEKEREKRYQIEDDKRTVKSYLDLRKDQSRHSAAIGGIRTDAADLDKLDDSKDAMPRKATRISARKPSRGGSRR